MPTQPRRLGDAHQADIASLVTAQAAQRQQIEDDAVAAALMLLAGFRDWYSTAAITAWAKQMAQLVETHQHLTAAVANAYMAQVLSTLTGRRVTPAPLVDVATVRTGVTHPGVYGRVADTWRYQASRLKPVDGQPAPDLVSPDEAARAKLEESVAADIRLADRAQQSRAMRSQQAVRHYRRVIHPELTKDGSCGTCAAASTRLYKVGDLLPMHNGCKCTVLPVVGQSDPGDVLNQHDLKLLYGVAGSTGRADLAKIRYRVDQHGELGPVLGAANQRRGFAQDTAPRKSPTRRGTPPQPRVGDFAATVRR
jgi:hypothetical protein